MLVIYTIMFIIHLLGGLWFALVLIISAALVAALGTWWPSLYNSLLFKGLLAGFFVNILLAALRRYPFKRKHLGFLSTHLGLLLIIAALFIKSIWGVQATLPLDINKPTNIAYCPEELVLEIKDRKTSRYVDAKTPFTLDGIKFSPGPLIPHAKVQLQLWHDGTKVTVFGAGSIPFFEDIKDVEPLRKGSWQILAIDCDTPQSSPSSVIFTKKGIHITDSSGQLFKHPYSLDQAPLFAFDEGYAGYGTSLQLPDGETFFGPLHLDIEESSEGERALFLTAGTRTIALHESGPAMPLASYLIKLMPKPVVLPGTTTLVKTWLEGDVPHAAIIIEGNEMNISTAQAGEWGNYRLFLSFFDKEHISLVVAKDPLGYKLLYAGIFFVGLGVVVLLGIRRC